MTQLQTILYSLINWSEGLAAIIAILYYKQLKNTYWKWFIIYITFIAFAEIFNVCILKYYLNFRKYYFDFIIIPIEYLFLYWLYAKKSLNNLKLFWFSYLIYGIFYFLDLLNYKQIRLIGVTNFTVGNLLLTIMVVLEFLKQIKSDDILYFKQNKMFYINIGVLLFYVGTLPLYTFDKYLYENAKELWRIYYTFFLFSVNLMYILFAASFIWGKPKT